jgi:hypothetical protein
VAPGGDVYVAWERNVDSNLGFSGDPYVYEHAARIPAGSSAVAIGGPAHPVVVSAGQPHGSPTQAITRSATSGCAVTSAEETLTAFPGPGPGPAPGPGASGPGRGRLGGPHGLPGGVPGRYQDRTEYGRQRPITG